MRLACAVLAVAATTAYAQPRPPAVDAIGVDERIGERVPHDLRFSDAVGRRIVLADVFSGDPRPVLLVLTYVRCRLLCSLVLRGVTEAVRAMPLSLGTDYRLVIVSIDPREEAASAAERTRALERDLGTQVQYLVGAERPIRRLADSLGFRFAWDDRTEQYAHPAVVFVLTPDGTIARYVHGVTYDPRQLASALANAARGERGVSTAIAESVLGCFRFDPAARAHREMIEGSLRAVGIALTAALAFIIVGLFLWERRRRVR